MSANRILVLGVGNLLLGDEGVGIHLINKMQKTSLPPGVEVMDGGTTSFELINYFRGRKKVIIVDAVKGDAEPGTILRFTPEDADLQWHQTESAHQLNLQELFRFARKLTPSPEIIVYGIVPKETKHFSMQLSRPVKRQLPRVITEIIREIKRVP